MCFYRGYKRFFRRSLLETSDFLKNDCLKINCTVGVVVSASDCPQHYSINIPESDIGSHFGALLDNMEGSDITFDVAGDKFPAHKLVLAARSPEFRSKFFNGLDEEKNEIIVTDLEPKVFKVKTICFPFPYFPSLVASSLFRIYFVIVYFSVSFLFLDRKRIAFFFLIEKGSYRSSRVKVQLRRMDILIIPLLQAMLHFIYKDTLTEEVATVSSTTTSHFPVSETLTAKLLAAADKYGLGRLRLICESCLCKDICVNSVADILTLADHCHATELKAVCLKFAAQNLAGILSLYHFLS